MGLSTLLVAYDDGEWIEVEDNAEREGKGLFVKMPADGYDGRPSIAFARLFEGFNNPAHLHDQPGFQVFLSGSVTFPRHHLAATAVHYSDANSGYGPFLVGPDAEFAVLQASRAGQTYLSDPAAREQRDKFGRELYGPDTGIAWTEKPGRRTLVSSEAMDWQNGPGGVRVKELIKPGSNGEVSARMYDCPPGAEITVGPAPFGEFHLLLGGTGSLDGTAVTPYAVRYVIGDEVPSPLAASDTAATWLTLTFDERSRSQRRAA